MRLRRCAAADSAANPYTDAQGATWTVYGRTMANDGTTVPLAGQAVVTATPTAKGIGSYNDWCFVVGTAETEEKVISGLGSQPVKPGDLVFHPANTTRVRAPLHAAAEWPVFVFRAVLHDQPGW